jgi:hypothetical protein
VVHVCTTIRNVSLCAIPARDTIPKSCHQFWRSMNRLGNARRVAAAASGHTPISSLDRKSLELFIGHRWNGGSTTEVSHTHIASHRLLATRFGHGYVWHDVSALMQKNCKTAAPSAWFPPPPLHIQDEMEKNQGCRFQGYQAEGVWYGCGSFPTAVVRQIE